MLENEPFNAKGRRRTVVVQKWKNSSNAVAVMKGHASATMTVPDDITDRKNLGNKFD